MCEINFASKTRFILNKENDIEPVPVCYLNKDQYLKLLLSYKDFICAIVKSNSSIRVSYRNQDNEVTYTCYIIFKHIPSQKISIIAKLVDF